MSNHPEPPSVTAIFLAMLRLGCTSFGGGSAGWLYRDIVLRRQWLDNATFLQFLSIGQALPVANGVKATVQIGQHLRGGAGAAAALTGLLSGPFVIILVVGAAYRGLGEHPLVQSILDGMAAVAIGLTFDTGLRSAWHGRPGIPALAITAATVLCIGILNWPMAPVVVVLAPLSVALAFRGRRDA